MDRDLLINFQPFSEFPESLLLINKKSNAFYIVRGDEQFIARQNIDYIKTDNIDEKEIIVCKSSYYDVLNNACVLREFSCYTIDEKLIEKVYNHMDVKVIHLSNLLSLEKEHDYYLTKNDVKTLVHPKNKKIHSKRK